MNIKNQFFTVEDINIFANASHDYNPLHCNYGYARKTLYGEQVVHGVLGVLACLGKIVEDKKKIMLSQLKVKFWKPLFCNIHYGIVIHTVNESLVKAYILDGEAKLLEMQIIISDKNCIESKYIPQSYNKILNTASNVFDTSDIKEGQLFEGEYRIQQDAIASLLRRFSLGGALFQNVIANLLWSSYFVGMIMPGQQALYAGLTFELDQCSMELNAPMRYSVRNKKLDARFNLLDMEFNCFYPGGDKMVHGNLSAFVRPKINYSNFSTGIISIKNYEKLRGKTVLITGASRGLGSALAQVFSAMSCHVIVNFQYSLDEAVNLQKQINNNGGEVDLWQGDIADIDWLSSKKEELEAKGKVIDILVCNACQSPKELVFEQNTISRINTYIQKNLEMTSVPLSVFAPMLNSNNGFGIVISSEFIEKPVALWPHYLAVKAAIEGLISSIAIKYNKMRWVIIRPPKLLTDMTNSPVSYQDLTDPFSFAKDICERIFSNTKQDVSESIEIFSPNII